MVGDAVQVVVRWGASVLHVDVVSRGELASCLERSLGEASAPLSALEGGRTRASADLGLASAQEAAVEVGELVVEMAEVPRSFEPAERPAGDHHHPLAGYAVSLAIHAAIVAAFVLFRPALVADPDAEARADRDELAAALARTEARAERATPPDPGTTPRAPGSDPGRRQSGGGGRAGRRDAAGRVETHPAVGGSSTRPSAGRRAAALAAPPALVPDARADARAFGMVALVTSDAHGPGAFVREAPANGADGALGDAWAPAGRDDSGPGGLALSSAGLGGGGSGDGDGLANDAVAPLVGGDIGLDAAGYAAAQHAARGPELRMCGPTCGAGGRLPPQIIRRVVHQNFGRFRLCYEALLRTNPSASGLVTVSFVIDEGGSVAGVALGASTFASSDIGACVTRAFGALSFPAPEGGVVHVTYPIAFSPADGGR